MIVFSTAPIRTASIILLTQKTKYIKKTALPVEALLSVMRHCRQPGVKHKRGLILKNKPYLLWCIIGVLLILNIYQFSLHGFSGRLSVVAVPDEKTAVGIAETVLLSVYGEDVLDKKPFHATFNTTKKEWIITSSLPEGYVGGVPEIVIRQSDGKIMKISHSM